LCKVLRGFMKPCFQRVFRFWSPAFNASVFRVQQVAAVDGHSGAPFERFLVVGFIVRFR
jgi:hypothetical protein